MFSLIGSEDTDLKIAGLKNTLPTDNGTTPPSEGRKTVRRSPAFNVVAPPHRPVFVRLEHAGIHRRHQLDIRPRLNLRIAVPHRPRLQAVPNLAIARVMRIENGFQVLRPPRVIVVNLESYRLQVPVRVHDLHLNHETINVQAGLCPLPYRDEVQATGAGHRG